MGPTFLELQFIFDEDGTGKLVARAAAKGFAGQGGAYFSTEQITSFAEQLAMFPLPTNPRPALSGGFWKKDRSGQLEQEHVGIEVYAINHRGHIGVQVRLAEEVWDHNRPEERHHVQLELQTTYEPLARFGRSLLALANGSAVRATLESETFP